MVIKKTSLSRQEPPAAGLNKKGKRPQILTDDKVRTLLSTPNVWYVIAITDTWISGVKANIENMTQRNIAHLAGKGKFVISQRKNTDGDIDIYCKFVPTTMEGE